MSFTKQDGIYVNSSKGINTEASLINFPEGFVTDEENFVITRSGAHHRRLGVDYEPSYVLSSEENTEDVYKEGGVSTYVWNNAGNIEGLSVLVVQEGHLLRFYKHSVASISANDLNASIDLDNFLIRSSSTSKLDKCQFSSGFGMLFVTSKAIEPLMIVLDAGSNTFLAKPIKVKIRDLKGLSEDLRPDEEPSYLTSAHKYNLINQGWDVSKINAYKSATGRYPSNAQVWSHGKKVNPNTGNETWDASELQNQQFGTSLAPRGSTIIEPLKKTAEITVTKQNATILAISNLGNTGLVSITLDDATGWNVGDRVTFSGTSAFTTTTVTVPTYNINSIWYGGSSSTTSTTYKYYEPLDGQEFEILSLVGNVITVKIVISTPLTLQFNQEGTATRLTVDEAAGTDLANTSFTSNTFSHGRAWYSGLGSGEFASYIFFSRVLEDPSLAGNCYQDADPTSEHISDLVASDGGYITIPEAGNILKIFSLDKTVIVFASKGIWTISGKDTAFIATDYEVNKISSIRLLGLDSIIDAEGVPLFFTDSGIYTIVKDRVTGKMASQSISINTIQELYNKIPLESLKYSVGTYDPVNKKAYWAYKSESNNSAYRYDFDSILCFDVVLEAFYKYRVANGTPLISGMFLASSSFSTSLPQQVVVGADNVQVNTVDVTVNIDVSSETSPNLIFYTAIPTGTGIKRTFSRILDSSFKDWSTFYNGYGLDYTSYLETGYEVLGDLMREKQVQWLYTFFDRTESGFTGGADLTFTTPSSCLVTVRYGWANSGNTNNSFGPVQAYIADREFYVPQNSGDTFDTGFPITYSKIKPRGAGKAIQFRFESEAGKDCKLLGWSAHLSGGSSV